MVPSSVSEELLIQQREVSKVENDETDSCRLKSMAEASFRSLDLESALNYAERARRACPSLDGIRSMIAALKILQVAAENQLEGENSSFIDYYKVFQIEYFSNVNSVKKQFKKLAMDLHPDKCGFAGCEEAFKVLGEGYKVLSDRISKNEYDIRLRIRIQESIGIGNEDKDLETFWTACTGCKLMQQFEKKYLGQCLVCPNCNMTFQSVEADNADECGIDRTGDIVEKKVFRSERLRKKAAARSQELHSSRLKEASFKQSHQDDGDISPENQNQAFRRGNEQRNGAGKTTQNEKQNVLIRRKNGAVSDRHEVVPLKKVKLDDETITLAEFQSQLKQKAKSGRQKENLTDMRRVVGSRRKVDEETDETSEKLSDLGLSNRFVYRRRSKSKLLHNFDPYDFESDRAQKCFKKGQIWAVYDSENDGMPRRYVLIKEVSANPFEVKLNWLRSTEKPGGPAFCVRFEVAGEMTTNSVALFSHIVNCEKAAREVYRIHPWKGSVWAIRRESSGGYDIVLFLTSYSDAHGVSIASLEKVDGCSALFKRQNLGHQHVRTFGRDDMPVISHHIPARKMPNGYFEDCWELDRASLPRDLWFKV